jgi:hypothetical protein
MTPRLPLCTNSEQVRALQLELLVKAEQDLGTRSTNYSIGEPRYDQDGPRLRFSSDRLAVWAELSLNAAGYWPTLVFELAHETVHLLDPVQGHTNFLEEGIATAFQLLVAPGISGIEIPVMFPIYLDALRLVESLPVSPIEVGRLVRARWGALAMVSMAQLQAIFPASDLAILEKLATTCVPR